jgi:enterobactin synthetase component D
MGAAFANSAHLCFQQSRAVFKCIFPLTRKFPEFSDVRITSFDWYQRHFTWTITSENMGKGRLLHDGKFVHTLVELPSLTDEVWHKMESVFTDKVSQKGLISC